MNQDLVPHKRGDAALKRGADELMNRAEYALRDKPRALSRVRRDYREFCLRMHRASERAVKVPR